MINIRVYPSGISSTIATSKRSFSLAKNEISVATITFTRVKSFNIINNILDKLTTINCAGNGIGHLVLPQVQLLVVQE